MLQRTTRAGAPADWLKLLNQVAQLLVREHEIVAVLTKRSGAAGSISLLFTADRSTDDDEDPLEYLVMRNPRRKPSPGPQSAEHPTESLHAIETKNDLLQYIYTHRKVPFRTHVQGVEILLNAVVDAAQTYHKTPDGDATEESENALTQLTLRKELLDLYVTFYSIGKMHRRLHSTMLEQFYTAMTSMSRGTVHAAVEDSDPSEMPLAFTQLESAVYKGILADQGISRTGYHILRQIFSQTYQGGKDSTDANNKTTWKVPSLFRWLLRLLGHKASSEHSASSRAEYPKGCAWEIHRLLVWVLNRARTSVDTLSTLSSSHSITLVSLTKALGDIQESMAWLHFMVHDSPMVRGHLKAIESTLFNAMGPKRLRSKFADSPSAQDIDDDGGLADINVEIDLDRTSHHRRLGEECLWLLVQYQDAVRSLTAQAAIPTHNVTFTLLSQPAGSSPKTALHDWKDVIAALYPPPSATVTSSTNKYIPCDEVITTLAEYGRDNPNPATHILRKQNHRFYGSWHAEAVLGTLRHLSKVPNSPAILGDIDLSAFRHTFNSIGVSKRCCPVCDKLLSLLGAPETDSNGSASMVLSSHQNFYPTGLPPHLPKDIAVELLQWLEKRVKAAVDKLVLKRRRDSLGSQESTGSSDSKGHSPRKGKKGCADTHFIMMHVPKATEGAV